MSGRATDSSPMEALAGLVERVTFHNAENGFCVLRVKVRGQRDLVTVVGHAAMISAGEFVQMSGRWFNDHTHGLQFKAEFLKASPPTTVEGIERYLGSGMIRGIGPVYAKKLVKAFGEAVFDLIEQEPGRLREVTGIGPKRAERIVAGWADQKVIREIMLFLHSNGVGTSRAVRIFKTYGQDAVRLISENPYRLAKDIRGIGFKTADQIARKMGIASDAMIRVRAGISYAIGEAMDEGHCGLPVGELLTSTAELLEVAVPLIETALALELEAGDVIADSVGKTGCLFLAGLYRAEQSIAERLRACAVGRAPWPEIDAEKAMTWVETKTGLALAPSQQEAVRLALRSKVLVITGGPGVGKTTLVNAILKIVTAKGTDVQLCAPTGRAAKRLSESTGLEGKTIHRLLETDPANGSFKRDDTNPLTCDLLVVDEASMVDVLLMRSLLRALPDSAALLIVGDVDQLPSVGPGQVLADIIGSGAVPVVRLTEVFRQAAQSRIITNAHRINEGKMPELSAEEGSDFYFVEAADPEIGLRKLLAVVRDRIPARFGVDPVRDVQVLCPMNRGGLGARSLNIELQQALNPPGEVKVERFGWTYGPGDKVMQIANDYDRDVFNGDLGVIDRIDIEEGELTVSFDGREVVYGFGELDELVLAYATTIHKSQGSEYPAVVIPLVTQHYAMLARNLLYTGVTRGRKLVVLVGQKKALAIAVRNQGGRRRWSKLKEWLADSAA
ncbi:SF1B family DNA helicase RecD2 [Acidomonas methanolica]|uniref:SF1B family DNA helicase RecD2 n=3 Tax=Acidomonas methanolica TaxID=437 RepID=UPI0010497A74|nr:ATP-dependent RecD-like DNA helicase [Acidomonas methanolica]MBU2653052.1 ATP-dependent RecD-like DNA helicase [Acidomonas methanolica]GEL00307.1 ATP-dependent RecD-like DNA helicase [Acidomonas methanolica NBRC 104435]